jgi:hypothetical protein
MMIRASEPPMKELDRRPKLLSWGPFAWQRLFAIHGAIRACDKSTIAARAALNWRVRALAKATNLHRTTITNIETGRYAGDEASLATIEMVLKRAGVEFINENGGGLGVRLRNRK